MTDTRAADAWHQQEADAVLRLLASSAESGLSDAAAAAALESAGPNEIESERPPSPLALLGSQLSDVMIGLLVVAAIVSGLLGDIVDTIAIVVIVVLNAAVGVLQEYRAQRAVAALREMSAPLAVVVRDGRELTIDAREVVPGDLVRLVAGDVVPADLRLVGVTGLGIDESALSGESVPVSKQVRALEVAAPHLSDRINMAFKGTLVTRGRGAGVVVATGPATEIGRIADLLRGERVAKTPLQTRLAVFSRRIAIAVLAIS
ncbi:MAG: HAD-IC family P-type ATPase, partial [Gammaproteobacteria bacterium]|nr:HAD-IC family P-type ATPase [Gammaproteobacteria bacterium]